MEIFFYVLWFFLCLFPFWIPFLLCALMLLTETQHTLHLHL